MSSRKLYLRHFCYKVFCSIAETAQMFPSIDWEIKLPLALEDEERKFVWETLQHCLSEAGIRHSVGLQVASTYIFVWRMLRKTIDSLEHQRKLESGNTIVPLETQPLSPSLVSASKDRSATYIPVDDNISSFLHLLETDVDTRTPEQKRQEYLQKRDAIIRDIVGLKQLHPWVSKTSEKTSTSPDR